jgi:hypothetical protein
MKNNIDIYERNFFMTPEFRSFNKISRFNREVIVTEKIDGTNGVIHITEDGELFVGSRNRWIAPGNDNYGFATWVYDHKDEIMTLGPGTHYGEWWGQGIQRKYGLKEKRFSMFNVSRWCTYDSEPKLISQENPKAEPKYQDKLPSCISLVPVLWVGMFEDLNVNKIIEDLRVNGSYAVPGFMNPEGIVIYHTAGKVLFKKTLDNDTIPKSKVK